MKLFIRVLYERRNYNKAEKFTVPEGFEPPTWADRALALPLSYEDGESPSLEFLLISIAHVIGR